MTLQQKKSRREVCETERKDNMGKIFKNMIPYWKPLILVLLLLFVQAWCDLSLPAYTSDIIDVGIQNQGIKHILPEALTPEEYEKAELLMTDEETASWEESYALNGSVYERNVTVEERLEELDDTFLVPLLMNYRCTMGESTFKKLMAEQMHTDESALDGMTIEQIGASMGVELKTFEKETQNEDGNTTTVTCVDMRDLLQAIVSGGMLEKDQLLSMRGELQLDARCHGQFACQIDGRGVRGRLRCGGRRGCGSNSEVLSVESRFENGGNGSDYGDCHGLSRLYRRPHRCRNRT